MSEIPLRRRRVERLVAGVCAGLAAHLGLPVAWVRIAMVVFALFGGAGALFYVWLWIFIPWDEDSGVEPMRRALTRPAGVTGSGATTTAGATAAPVYAVAAPSATAATTVPSATSAPSAATHFELAEDPGVLAQQASPRRHWPVAELLLGAGLLFAGVGLVLAQLGVRLPLELLLPAIVVLVGVGLAWWQIADRDRPERYSVPRVLGALALVAVGVLMFFITAREPSVFTVIFAAFAVLAGVALSLAPWLLRLNSELMAERAGRAREAERAEIAAHLHDSVLQTLALIQQRSDPGSEVARLARGQERELREWLFRGADGAPQNAGEAVDAELRSHAAALEHEWAVRFEIVAVGASGNVRVPEAIVSAAREAMLNAARHAGGDVTVFIEVGPKSVSIDVTDRGPGVDITTLPDGRMGVRESILGRMERAGGSARVVSGPGGTGTSVRLFIPLDAAIAQGTSTTEQSPR
ncbi:ATP-binding protein [Leucobacter sp. W1478]|uniref:ATP-binding protein n=1 Tax=Leucobacter sp. W1478 TaxID=3439065 RepID=UPI003F3EFC92